MPTTQVLERQYSNQLTAEEFINILKSVNKHLFSKYYTSSPSFNEGKEYVYISDVEITEEIKITDIINNEKPIFIVGCAFKKGIQFVGGKFGYIKFDQTDFYYLSITNGIFESTFELNGCSVEKICQIGAPNFNRVEISNTIFNSSFYVYNPKTTGEFTLINATFNNTFDIKDGGFGESFIVKQSKFANNFDLSGGTFTNLFGAYGNTFKQGFSILGGTFKKNVEITGSTIEKELYLGEFIPEKDFEIRGVTANRIEIDNRYTSIQLNINNQCNINTIMIVSHIKKESVINIGCELFCLIFKDVLNFGTIVLTSVSARKRDVVLGEASSRIELNELDGIINSRYDDYINSPEIRIERSDLGKTTFINCDLRGFGLNITSSKITDVFVTGTRMPREIITKDVETGLPDYRQYQLGYSQIKKIYEARGDKVEANRYYALEMEAYYTTLSWCEEGWEKANLWLNRFSTNFGQSWKSGLSTTLGVSVVFYILYCLSLGFLPAWPDNKSWEQFGVVASYYLEFVNPIHKADYIAQQLLKSEKDVTACARSIEGISRIFIAYFVYQLIQAFRKHGKASG